MPSDPTELLQLMLVLYDRGMMDLGEFYEQVKIDISPELKARIEETSDLRTLYQGYHLLHKQRQVFKHVKLSKALKEKFEK